MDKDTILALVRLAASMICYAASIIGIAIDSTSAITLVCVVLAVICFLWSWWKNNNITEAAATAEKVLIGLKNGTIEAVETIATEENEAEAIESDTE